MIEVTLRLDTPSEAARVFTALAEVLSDVPFVAEITDAQPERPREPASREPASNGADPEIEAPAGIDPVEAALATKLKVRLTVAMGEVLVILCENGSADRDLLARLLPYRTSNSTSRSLGGLERAGLASPRFEGSSHWLPTPLGVAVFEGRIPLRIDAESKVAPEDREEAQRAHERISQRFAEAAQQARHVVTE